MDRKNSPSCAPSKATAAVRASSAPTPPPSSPFSSPSGSWLTATDEKTPPKPLGFGGVFYRYGRFGTGVPQDWQKRSAGANS